MYGSWIMRFLTMLGNNVQSFVGGHETREADSTSERPNELRCVKKSAISAWSERSMSINIKLISLLLTHLNLSFLIKILINYQPIDYIGWLSITTTSEHSSRRQCSTNQIWSKKQQIGIFSEFLPSRWFFGRCYIDVRSSKQIWAN